jgi:Transcription factor WhiB
VSVDLRSDPEVAGYSGDPAELVEALSELLGERPWWHERAACRGQGASRWWPGRGKSLAPLKAICAGCPVQAECRRSALERRGCLDGGGIWGGTSARERKRLRREGTPGV